MLPFLKKKYEGSPGLIIKVRPSDKPEAEQEGSAIEAIAKDIIEAIQIQDHKMLAQALKDAFQAMELEPHDEVSHEQDQE